MGGIKPIWTSFESRTDLCFIRSRLSRTANVADIKFRNSDDRTRVMSRVKFALMLS